MNKEEAIKFWEFRYENAKDFNDPHWEAQERREQTEYVEALRMAIEALSAEAVPQSEQYKKGFEDAKRAFLIEYARESENMRKRNAELEVMLNAQKAISAEAEWIPCSERLPDIKEYHVSEACLVYCENGAYGFAELEENIFGQVGWDCEREDEYYELLGEVIAWMPLPTPYKGGDEE